MMEALQPTIGSRWKHHNGNLYTVLLLTNSESTRPEEYPITVVYQGANGLIWSRPLSNWYRSFIPAE